MFGTLYLASDYQLVYQDNADVLFLRLEDDEVDEMKAGMSLVEYRKNFRLHQHYHFERRKFKNKAAASQAIKRMVERVKKHDPSDLLPKLDFDAAINVQKPDVKFKQKFQRIGELEQSKTGPIEVRSFGNPKWIYPRPPMLCSCCGNPLVHVATYYGPLDPLLGKRSCVVVSGCRLTENSDCQGMIEVVFQRSDRKPKSSSYYENAKTKQFFNLHMSEQVDSKEKVHYSVAVHRGFKSQPGWVTWHACKNLDAAKATINRMKLLHVTGNFKESKKPDQNPKPERYETLYQSMALPDTSGKPFKPTSVAAKRVSEGYETETAIFSDSPTTGNFEYGRDQLIAGGEPHDRRRFKMSSNMKKWSSSPFLFFADFSSLSSLNRQLQLCSRSLD